MPGRWQKHQLYKRLAICNCTMAKHNRLDEGTRRNLTEIRRLVLDLNRTADTLEDKLDLVIESLHGHDLYSAQPYENYHGGQDYEHE